jgi:ABC-type branched-subunit amino acid transport system substrate-binding protein
MRRSYDVFLVIGAVLLVIAASSISSLNEVRREPIEKPPKTIETVRIGVMSPSQASLPEYRFLSRLAEEEINDYCNRTGVPKRFEFILTCPEGQATRALELTEEYHGTDLIVGGGWSSQLYSITEYADKHNMIILSPASTSPLLAKKDNAIRLCPNDYVQGEVIAAVLRGFGIDSVAVIQRGDAWAAGISNQTRRRFAALGGTTMERIIYPADTMVFKKYLDEAEPLVAEAIKEHGREHVAVLLLCYLEGASILNEAAAYPALLNITWFGSDGSAKAISFEEQSPEESSKVKVISTLAATPSTETYGRINALFEASEEYKARPMEEPLSFHEANIYDGCWLLALSSIEANSTDGDAVLQAFPKVAAEYGGATGKVILDENLDRTSYDYDLWGYFKAEGKCRSLVCGLYNASTSSVKWDTSLIQPP